MGSTQRIGIAAALLVSALASTEGVAMEPGYRIASVKGPAPASAPVPHLATASWGAGQALPEGSDLLLLADTTLVLVNDEKREIAQLVGPNRLRVRGGALVANEPAGLTVLAPQFFADPKTAVKQTASWLRASAWLELARHYDLSGTDVPLSSLLSGAFFVRERPPEVAHPGFSRFKQPFSPSFTYQSHRTLEGGDVEVRVGVAIDQGGGMVQRGYDTFVLRSSPRGLQLRPRAEAGEGKAP